MNVVLPTPANDDRPASVTVELDVPLKRGDTSIETITLLRTNLGGLRGLSLVQLAQMNVDEVRTLLPRITAEGLIQQEVDLLDPADTMQIAIELSQFLTTTSDRDDTDTAPAGDRPMLVRIPLDVPVVRGEGALTSITLRRPDTGSLRGVSLRALGQLSVDEMLTILPRITVECLSSEEAASIDMADGMAIGQELGDFLLPRRHRAA